MKNAEEGKNPHGIPGAVVARYRDAVAKSKGVKGPTALFFLIQEFVKDPSCLSIKFIEEHVKMSMKYNTAEWAWMTPIEVKIMFRADVLDEGKIAADKVLAAAKQTKPHPMMPKAFFWLPSPIPIRW